MGLQEIGKAYYVSYATALGCQSDETIVPFVLQGIDRIGYDSHRRARLEDVFVRYAVILVEGAAEAGINHYDGYIGTIAEYFEILQMQVFVSYKSRVGDAQAVGQRVVAEPGGRQVETLFRYHAQGVVITSSFAGFLHVHPHVADDKLLSLAHRTDGSRTVQVFRVEIAVVVQDGQVQVGTHHFVHQMFFYRIVVGVVHIADAVGASGQ